MGSLRITASVARLSAVIVAFFAGGCQESGPAPAPSAAGRTSTAAVEKAPAGSVSSSVSSGSNAAPPPSPDVLLVESFDTAASLEAWSRMSGAELAPAPENEITWDAGAVRMKASVETRKWVALYRDI